MAEAHVRGGVARIEEARAQVAEAQAMLGYAKITAPFAGRVVERRVDPGNLAAPGAPLLVLEDAGASRVEVAVDESRRAALQVGGDATIEIGGASAPIAGKIAEIVPSVDVASRAFLVKLDLPESAAGIPPGTFARALFRVGEHDRLVVPRTAVTSLGALDRVFVVDGERARLRMVTLGEAQGVSIEVLSGLSAGERVVAAPPPGLADGARLGGES
jgi:RND family efflux transporter MFP subunit